MYCGDRNILGGLSISVLSLIKQTDQPLSIYVLTMNYKIPGKKYYSITNDDVKGLSKKLKRKNPKSEINVLNITDIFMKDPTTANRRSYFTPFAMLRLYAEQIPNFPDKVLYLDTDVVCLSDPSEFYDMDISKYEMIGALDRYGGKIFRLPFTKQQYLNSGVLLFNLKLIRETGLFKKAREMCKRVPMIMPDQSALNFCVKYKKIVGRKFNDQKEVRKDTVFRHFSNTFKFFPYFKVQKIKPWDEEKLHAVLKTHEFDDILAEWRALKEVK